MFEHDPTRRARTVVMAVASGLLFLLVWVLTHGLLFTFAENHLWTR